jgi:hypothetical protein
MLLTSLDHPAMMTRETGLVDKTPTQLPEFLWFLPLRFFTAAP